MKTVYVVFESSWHGKFISAIFENKWEADEYAYDYESVSYTSKAGKVYDVEEWEVQ